MLAQDPRSFLISMNRDPNTPGADCRKKAIAVIEDELLRKHARRWRRPEGLSGRFVVHA